MRRIVLIIILVGVVGFFGVERIIDLIASQNIVPSEKSVSVPGKAQDATDTSPQTLEIPERTVIAENLTIPWDIVFFAGAELLVSERDGTIVRIDTESGETQEIEVPDVVHRGEGGLLGMVAHPDFENNRQLYVYLTSRLGEEQNASVNKVIRYRFLNNSLTDRTVIVDNIPGSLYHNGGRIAFGPDGMLYVATGDAREPELAQDTNSLAGKILRVDENGGVPDDNPFGNRVYSYGHRNPQGLTWDEDGNLWSTEHGRTTATLSGMDELNLVIAGGNYGWPDSEGDSVAEGTIGPKIHSGASVTWAPASAVYYDGSVFFGGLRGETLYEAVLDGTSVSELREHFAHEYGRIRSALRGPEGALYITTSNRDGRGDATDGYDQIIRLDPAQFRE